MNIFLLLLNLFLIQGILVQEDKLVFLMQIIVGGNEETNSQKPASEKIYTLIKNPLSTVGMKQMYIIGKSVQEQYPDFWPEKFNQSYFQLYSNNGQSQKSAAICFAQGLRHGLKAPPLENNDIKYFVPPIKDEDFSWGYVIDPEYALPGGISFIPIEFAEENNDIMFNASNDCEYLVNQVAKKQKAIYQESESIFSNLYKNLKKQNYMGEQIEHPEGQKVYEICYDIYINSFQKSAQDNLGLANECLYFLYIFPMIVYKDISVAQSSITYFKKHMLKLLLKKFPQYDPSKKDKKQQEEYTKYLGNIVNINFMALFLLFFQPRILDVLLSRYKGQVDSFNFDQDLSFYNEFGFTQNFTFEFYERKDGSIYYIQHMNNKKEEAEQYSLNHLIEILSFQADKNFSKKCDRRHFEQPEPNNTPLIIMLLLQSLILILFSLKFFGIYKLIKSWKINQEIEQQELMV